MPLAGVNVQIKNTFIGTSTDPDGFFLIDIKPGKYELVFSFIGYETKVQKIEFDKDIELHVFLHQVLLTMKGIIVEAERVNQNIETNYRLTARSMSNMPAFVEPDVFRAASYLPGVINYNDLKGDITIRGSSPDQTQVLFDGMEIYYPFHLFGALGSFNLNPIDDVRIYTGGFPANYGGRAGGIIDLKTKDFSGKRELNINVSLLTSGIYYNNMYKKTGISFAARKTYFDILSKFVYPIPYGYVDANFKVYRNFSKHWRIDLLGYINNDFLTVPADQIGDGNAGQFNFAEFFNNFYKGKNNWGNRLLGIKSSFKKSDFQLEGLFYNSLFFMYFLPYIKNRLNNYTMKLDFKYLKYSNLLFNSGIQLQKMNQDYFWKFNNRDLLELFPAGIFPDDQHLSNVFFNTFFNAEKIINRWDMSTGFRYSFVKNKAYFEPRFSFKFKLDNTTKAFATFGKYTQFLVSPFDNNELTIGNPLVLTKRPLHVYNISLGLEKKLTPLTHSKVEIYRKYMTYLPLDKNNYISHIKTGTASVNGVDVFFIKNKGFLTWQLAYTFLKTRGYYNGHSFPLDWDITHNLSILFGTKMSKGWYTNLGIFVHSGKPYSPVISSYYGIIDKTDPYYNERFIYGKRNSTRYPYYARLDFSVRKTYTWKKVNVEFSFQIINLFYRKNILNVNWSDYYSDFYYDENGNQVRKGIDRGVPILPSVGVKIIFK